MKAQYIKKMVSNIKNFNFYIKDDIGISPIKNNIISIFKSSYNGFYKVEVDYILYERFMKIYQITKNDKLKKYLISSYYVKK